MLCSDELDVQRSDARTLVTLLHLRDIADRTQAEFSIVSELLDDRNRELAEVARVDDMIVSDRLISLMLAQISENRYLKDVFADLFAAEGSEVYLKPLSDYVDGGGEVSFATLSEAALRRGEVAIGYRVRAEAGESAKAYGIRVNPPSPASFARRRATARSSSPRTQGSAALAAGRPGASARGRGPRRRRGAAAGSCRPRPRSSAPGAPRRRPAGR